MRMVVLLVSICGATASSAPKVPQSVHAIAHAERGLTLAASNRQAEAVAALELSLSLIPEHAPTHLNLGLVWEQVGLPTSALSCYAEAVTLDPSSSAAYGLLGELMATEFGEKAMAEDALRTAVELEPTRADSWNRLGKLLHSRGELDASSNALEVARTLSPLDNALVQNLATVLRSQGRFDESSQMLRAAAGDALRAGDSLAAESTIGEVVAAADGQATAAGEAGEAEETGETGEVAASGQAAVAAREAAAMALAFAPETILKVRRDAVAEAQEAKARAAEMALGGGALMSLGGRVALTVSEAPLPDVLGADWRSRLARVYVTRVSQHHSNMARRVARRVAALEFGWSASGRSSGDRLRRSRRSHAADPTHTRSCAQSPFWVPHCRWQVRRSVRG